VDKLVGNAVKKVMGTGEKIAPVKSLKLKIKFQKVKTQALQEIKEHGRKR
jgi:hypothetical protein